MGTHALTSITLASGAPRRRTAPPAKPPHQHGGANADDTQKLSQPRLDARACARGLAPAPHVSLHLHVIHFLLRTSRGTGTAETYFHQGLMFVRKSLRAVQGRESVMHEGTGSEIESMRRLTSQSTG